MRASELTTALKSVSRKKDMKYIDVLRLFFAEEFMSRLNKSEYEQNLILRGGFLVRVLTEQTGNYGDLDFLYTNAPEIISAEHINNMMQKVLDAEMAPIKLDIVNIQQLEPLKSYSGYSVTVMGRLGSAQLGFKINIGLDDVLFHETESVELPQILPKFNGLSVKAYPVESIIAEKLDILLRRFELNRCMQHLYDIFILAHTFDFDGFELQRAIRATLSHRHNDCGAQRIRQIASLTEDENMLPEWLHFARVNEIEYDFDTVINRTVKFIEPIWNALHNESRYQRNWSANSGRWEEPVYLF